MSENLTCPITGKNSESNGERNACSANGGLKFNDNINDYDFSKTNIEGSKLSKERVVSTIPKSSYTPSHQPNAGSEWVYPSEQQYYAALKKKGYDTNEKDVPIVLAIHNTVNEQCWTKIKEWEALSGNENPTLRRFTGRPKDTSPKAFLKSLLGYSKPFDRHDWMVERRNGEEVRYVIDFYQGAPSRYSPVSIYLDVRPALDSYGAFMDRISFWYRSMFRKPSLPKSCLETNPFFQNMRK